MVFLFIDACLGVLVGEAGFFYLAWAIYYLVRNMGLGFGRYRAHGHGGSVPWIKADPVPSWAVPHPCFYVAVLMVRQRADPDPGEQRLPLIFRNIPWRMFNIRDFCRRLPVGVVLEIVLSGHSPVRTDVSAADVFCDLF